jgi:hypothetical protein
MTFLVGVVGHRPHRLQDADLAGLASALREVLSLVRSRAAAVVDADGHGMPRPMDLAAISALAEGADLIFAEQALALGYRLLCPMPFARAEYERDFVGERAEAPDALVRFQALLRRAASSNRLTTVELPGDRRREAEAYAEAGHLIVAKSDLLVAVWDGAGIGLVGGTGDVLRMARERGLPVIWVRARAPHRWSALTDASPAIRDDGSGDGGAGVTADDRAGVEAAIDRAFAAARAQDPRAQ